MKKIILILLAIPLLYISCEDDDSKYNKSLLEGKWEIAEIMDNNVVREHLSQCEKDNIWTFSSDGKITNYNPCLMENAAIVTGNWKIKDDILYVDEAVSMAATSKILELTSEKLVLLRQYGSYATITETYKKNDSKAIEDYALSVSGEFVGEAYYADHLIGSENLPDSHVTASLTVNKILYGVASVKYSGFNICEKKDTVICEKVPAYRNLGVTWLELPNIAGPLKVIRNNVDYDLVLQRTRFTNGLDSVYTSIWIREKGKTQFSEFQYFAGKRK